MTQPGQFGRSAPGESWRRAMEEVAERRAAGAKRRYRVYGRQIEPGWWAYRVSHITGPPPVKKEPVPLTRDRIAGMAAKLPRCAQRSRANHGGNSKVAWPNAGVAGQVAGFVGGSAYRCQLPAPAIGEHWHVTSKKKRKR